MRSGLLSLAVAVSEMMSTGPIADNVSVATRLIDEVGATSWRGSISKPLLRRIPADAAQVQQDLGVIARLRKELAARLDTFADRLDTFYTEEVGLIRQMLSSKVQAFIPEALAALQDSDLAQQASQIDVKLRIRLETAYLAAIHDAAKMLASRAGDAQVGAYRLTGRRGPA